MTIEIRILNFKLALRENKPKSVVKYKFRKYCEEYDEMEGKNVIDKVTHRDLSMEYFKYMLGSGDRDDRDELKRYRLAED